MKPTTRILSLLIFLLLGQACTTVKPWERGILAKPEMAWVPDPLDGALYKQIYFSKEASSGTAAAAGGGCGCN